MKWMNTKRKQPKIKDTSSILDLVLKEEKKTIEPQYIYSVIYSYLSNFNKLKCVDI